jgi:hypothetical protein
VNQTIGSSLLWIKPFTAVYAPLQPSTTHLPLAENLAISRLIQAAQAGIQANLAQDLAQIGQMTSLIAGNATKIVKSLRQLRRLNFSGAINALTAGRGNQGITRGRLSAEPNGKVAESNVAYVDSESRTVFLGGNSQDQPDERKLGLEIVKREAMVAMCIHFFYKNAVRAAPV